MTPTPRLVFLLGFLLAAGPARADDLAEAKALFKQAEARFKSADYRAALELYQQAYAKKPLPGFHFNIAQCHRNLGEHGKAVEHFKLYLESSKNAKHSAEARRLLAICEAELQKQQPPAPPPAEAKPEPASIPAARPEPAPARASRRTLRPPLFWTGVAVSAALLATGTITGALALQKSSRFKDLATPSAELGGLRDSGEALRTTSTVTFAVGAATSIATGLLFFFTDFKGGKERSVSAAPLPGGALVTVGGGF
jgi:hypothetical protein